jgi:hypothetical protein
MSWKTIHLGTEGDSFALGGVSVWTTQWKSQGEQPIAAKHPAYPSQEHQLKRYFIQAGGVAHEFAAGEVSPGVWLFAVPVRTSANLVLLHIAAYVTGAAGCFILVRGFEHSLVYAVLGSALVALALAAEWYAKSRQRASVA